MTVPRVSLVYPADGVCYKYARARTRRMPLGLAYIAAACESLDMEVFVTDAALDDLSVDETVAQALEAKPHILGIGCTTPIYHRAVEIAHKVKLLSPRTVVVMGGPHVSALPEATLRTSETDYVVIGEGEETFPLLAVSAAHNYKPHQVPGVASRHHLGKAYRLKLGQSREDTMPAIDLNRVPVPARHLFRYQEYCDHARDVVEPQTGAMFSRGCPGKCSFCGAADTLVRFRHLDNIVEEMRLITRMGIGNVFVMDDTYTSQRKRVLELSRRLTEACLPLTISVQLRLDQVDREICDALYASGVRYVGPGIESGNEDIIRQIGKGPRESKDNMRRKVALLKGYPWKVRCSYVMGMPGETEAQILETIAFAKELGAHENAFSIVVPYPDSPLWATAMAAGKVAEDMDFSRFLYYHEIGCNLSAVPTERLLELHEYAYAEVGNPAYKLEDNSVSSGHRPHIPYRLQPTDEESCS